MNDPVALSPGLSLVVTTLGRTSEVETLFGSLARQTFCDFDVVVVDQNDDDRLAFLFDQPWPFPVRRCHTPGERGASRGRNRGWRLTAGRTVLFPDDDCWYPRDFLERSMAAMREWQCDVLAGRPADEDGRTINGRFQRAAGRTDRANVWTTAIEWMVFFRRTVLEAIGGFDEDVGVGAATPWHSAEIQDIILRAMKAGFVCWFDPEIIGHHAENVVGIPDRRAIRKARAYARGMGFVLRLHGYGLPTIGKWIGRPLAGSLLSLARGRLAMSDYYANIALGRLEGAVRRTVR